MSNESEEFATEPVPDSSTVGWFKVAMVAAMVAFSLPTFLTGVEVSAVSSPQRTAQMMFVGSLILTILGSITAGIGSSTRLSSYMLNRVAFGVRGAAIVNLAFAVSLLGWFGVNIDLFAEAVLRLARDLFDQNIPGWPVELFAGVVMTLTTMLGFQAINRLSMLLVPVLIAVTALLITGALNAQSLSDILVVDSVVESPFGDGVSAVVGAVIVGAVILPDITRFIRHWSGAVYVVIISYFFVNMIVMSAGALSAAALNEADLLNIMVVLGIGWAAFAIVIFGSWVLNSLNLYSTMLSVESTVPRLDNRLLILVIGALGTLAAFFNILDYFLSFLFYLSIVFVPVAGVIAVDYLLLRHDAYHEQRIEMESPLRVVAIIAWMLGACVALMGSFGWFTLTGIAALDAMSVTALSYYLFTLIEPFTSSTGNTRAE